MTLVREDGTTVEDLIKALLSVLNSNAANGLGLPEQLYSQEIAAVAEQVWRRIVLSMPKTVQICGGPYDLVEMAFDQADTIV